VMMKETLLVFNRRGVAISDPSYQLPHGLRWRTGLPGGFLDCEWYVPLGMLRKWAVKEAYSIRIYDGLRCCYWGRIEDLSRFVNLPGKLSNALRKVTAFGFWVNCVQRIYTGSHTVDDGDTIITAALGNCPLISADTDEINNTGFNLGAIDWTDIHVSDVVRDVISYGDNATPPNAWHFAVWDGERTSDRLAKAWLFAKNVSDYDLQIPLEAIDGQVTVTSTLAEAANYVITKYDQNYTAAAQDAASQAAYDRRDYLFLAQGVLATAQNLRDRYLELHKDPQTQMSAIRLRANPLTKAGAPYEMNRVRAGMRVIFPELRRVWDKIYYIVATDYDSDAHTLMLTFDEPVQMIVPREIVEPAPPPGPPPEPFRPGPPHPWIPGPVPRRWPGGPPWV